MLHLHMRRTVAGLSRAELLGPLIGQFCFAHEMVGDCRSAIEADCGSAIAEVQQVQQKPMQSGQGQGMRPARDKAWVQTSAARLQLLIAQVLPPLAAHPRMAVRTPLAQGQPAALHPVLYLPLLLTLYARPVSHGRPHIPSSS